jgi:hypothetical protein
MVDKICVNEARAVIYMALTMNCNMLYERFFQK